MRIINADRWRIRHCILFLTLQVKGNLSVLLNQEELNRGICDGQMLNVSIDVTCEFSGARARIKGGNEITHCENRICAKGGQFSGTVNILNVFFPMDYKSHIDNLLEVNVTCADGSVFKDELHMVPCLSQFHHSVVCNRTHARITCENNSYNLSKYGMTIKNFTTGNTLDHCWWRENSSECFRELAKGLPNGSQLILPNVNGHEVLICEMDGQFVNINITCDQAYGTDGLTSGQEVHSNTILPFGCVLLSFLVLLLPQYCC